MCRAINAIGSAGHNHTAAVGEACGGWIAYIVAEKPR